ncbi:hypothetical protein DFH09DRAFT_1363790 [Mycena vulgaris]|nr:hypothetical protein DFH09DRAFT_1363790 [Mycena vulgaris]
MQGSATCLALFWNTVLATLTVSVEAPKPSRLFSIDSAISQVAAHPQSPAFSAPSHHDHHRHRDSRPRFRHDCDDAPTPGALSLPCTLARPPFTDIASSPSSSATACAPDARRNCSPCALAPLHLPTSLPRSHLPAAFSVPLRAFLGPNSVSYPTHALAIASAAKGKGGQAGGEHPIFPVHAVVLAAHCVKLPRLPPSAPAGSSRTAGAMLPVLPLTLPSPHAFALLHAFMYTRRLAPALTVLLPLPPAFFSSSSSHGRSGEELTYSTLPAAFTSPPALHALASHLQDMVALGVYDPELAGLVVCRQGKSGQAQGGEDAIFPVHAVVLTAHCAKLPRLPPSAPAGSSRTASGTLSVLPLTLPSPLALLHVH